jgi:hypothetical protein
MDLEIWTSRPEREHACPACRARRDGRVGNDHTCRTPPATPRAERAAQARADDRVLADYEGSIRAVRLAEIRRGRAG